jgi:hypothetical protein
LTATLDTTTLWFTVRLAGFQFSHSPPFKGWSEPLGLAEPVSVEDLDRALEELRILQPSERAFLQARAREQGIVRTADVLDLDVGETGLKLIPESDVDGLSRNIPTGWQHSLEVDAHIIEVVHSAAALWE